MVTCSCSIIYSINIFNMIIGFFEFLERAFKKKVEKEHPLLYLSGYEDCLNLVKSYFFVNTERSNLLLENRRLEKELDDKEEDVLILAKRVNNLAGLNKGLQTELEALQEELNRFVDESNPEDRLSRAVMAENIMGLLCNNSDPYIAVDKAKALCKVWLRKHERRRRKHE